jgi:hypothetical protein
LYELDLTDNVLLEYLYCFNNNLVMLDLTKSPLLIKVNTDSNKLTEIHIDELSNLTEISCSNNLLSDYYSLMKNLTNIREVNIKSNLFEALYLSLNPTLLKLNCVDNPTTKSEIIRNIIYRLNDDNPMRFFKFSVIENDNDNENENYLLFLTIDKYFKYRYYNNFDFYELCENVNSYYLYDDQWMENLINLHCTNNNLFERVDHNIHQITEQHLLEYSYYIYNLGKISEECILRYNIDTKKQEKINTDQCKFIEFLHEKCEDNSYILK